MYYFRHWYRDWNQGNMCLMRIMLTLLASSTLFMIAAMWIQSMKW